MTHDLFFNSAAFLLLYGIALAIEGWGVVASLKIYPPFAGAAVSAITLVVAFGFAVSRPCLTLKVRGLLPNYRYKGSCFSYPFLVANSSHRTPKCLNVFKIEDSWNYLNILLHGLFANICFIIRWWKMQSIFLVRTL